jgi:hypothetical protein
MTPQGYPTRRFLSSRLPHPLEKPMIRQAGLDEAGLGPTLGPLVTAMAVFTAPSDAFLESAWDLLSEAVTASGPASDARLWVGDSKEVHGRGGIKALEKAVLAFLTLRPPAKGAASRDAFLASVGAGEAAAALAACPWHASAETKRWLAPVAADPASIRAAADRLRGAMASADAGFEGFRARVLLPSMLNASFAAGKNKHETALAAVAELLREERDRHAGALTVVVDKQGGRDRYGPFLSHAFGGAWWEAVREGRHESTYRRSPEPGMETTITFRPKADATSFATALASLFAKYLRERLMLELNRWFAAREPSLAPTAGYHTDAKRFLAAAAGVIARESIDLHHLVRTR